ncbi:MAG: acyl-CoA carboxylase subunit epsilon [Candidatus Nanopelagicales bacterium]
MSGFVVRHGKPTAEELGVVIAVLRAAVASRLDHQASTHTPVRFWSASTQLARPALMRPGRGAWVMTGRLR